MSVTLKRNWLMAIGLIILPMTLMAQFGGFGNQQNLTEEQRTAQREAQAKRAELQRNDYERMKGIVGVKPLPTLPSVYDDPTRPMHLTHDSTRNRNNWYDEMGNVHIRSSWGIWSNYDETKAGSMVATPPVMKMNNGAMVTDKKTWENKRRPEVMAAVEKIYGKIPKNTPKVTFEVTEVDENFMDGKAIFKAIVGHIDNSAYPSLSPEIRLELITPKNASGPVPVMVNIGGGLRPRAGGFGGGGGNPNANANAPRPMSPQEEAISIGWGYAAFNNGLVQADNGAGLTEGIIGLVNKGQPRSPDDWGSLVAWSWGLSRCIDYFETDKNVDAKQLGITGHSRNGKAALVAGAYDQRWLMVWPSCSGAMGSSLQKRNWGEMIDNVAGISEYHWMAGNFLKYAGNWDAMPIDAHFLCALIAPRLLFNTGGTSDQWSDPHGEFLASVGADPVYHLYGEKGLGRGINEFSEPDELVGGKNAFREHIGGHTPAPDWPAFYGWAQQYVKVKGTSVNTKK